MAQFSIVILPIVLFLTVFLYATRHPAPRKRPSARPHRSQTLGPNVALIASQTWPPAPRRSDQPRAASSRSRSR